MGLTGLEAAHGGVWSSGVEVKPASCYRATNWENLWANGESRPVANAVTLCVTGTVEFALLRRRLGRMLGTFFLLFGNFLLGRWVMLKALGDFV